MNLYAGQVESSDEARLVVQALRINTLSKLTFSDSIAFDALVKDVFPGVPFKDIEYETLREKLKEVCAENNLMANEVQVSFPSGDYRYELVTEGLLVFIDSQVLGVLRANSSEDGGSGGGPKWLWEVHPVEDHAPSFGQGREGRQAVRDESKSHATYSGKVATHGKCLEFL